MSLVFWGINRQQGLFEKAVVVCRDDQGKIQFCQRAQRWRRCLANSDGALDSISEPFPAIAAQLDGFRLGRRRGQGLRKTLVFALLLPVLPLFIENDV